MPTIKNAFERHKILDRCFRDRRRNIILTIYWILSIRIYSIIMERKFLNVLYEMIFVT